MYQWSKLRIDRVKPTDQTFLKTSRMYCSLHFCSNGLVFMTLIISSYFVHNRFKDKLVIGVKIKEKNIRAEKYSFHVRLPCYNKQI